MLKIHVLSVIFLILWDVSLHARLRVWSIVYVTCTIDKCLHETERILWVSSTCRS